MAGLLPPGPEAGTCKASPSEDQKQAKNGDVIVNLVEETTMLGVWRNIFPSVPPDDFFKLQATTFRIRLPKPGNDLIIGTTFIEFLEEEVDATLEMARPDESWISANVFLSGSLCQVEVRFYQEKLVDGEVVCAVELQRGKGYAVTFHQLFQQVKTFYQSRKYDIVVPPKPSGASLPTPVSSAAISAPLKIGTGPPKPFGLRAPGLRAPPKPPQLGGEIGAPAAPEICEGELVHLFDQMLVSEAPSLQAEAFNSIRSLARENPQLINALDFITNVKYILKDALLHPIRVVTSAPSEDDSSVAMILANEMSAKAGPSNASSLKEGLPNDPEAQYAFALMLAEVAGNPECVKGSFVEQVTPLLLDKEVFQPANQLIKKKLAEAVLAIAKNLQAHCTYERASKLIKTPEKGLQARIQCALKGGLHSQHVQKAMQDALKVCVTCVEGVDKPSERQNLATSGYPA